MSTIHKLTCKTCGGNKTNMFGHKVCLPCECLTSHLTIYKQDGSEIVLYTGQGETRSQADLIAIARSYDAHWMHELSQIALEIVHSLIRFSPRHDETDFTGV